MCYYRYPHDYHYFYYQNLSVVIVTTWLRTHYYDRAMLECLSINFIITSIEQKSKQYQKRSWRGRQSQWCPYEAACCRRQTKVDIIAKFGYVCWKEDFG